MWNSKICAFIARSCYKTGILGSGIQCVGLSPKWCWVTEFLTYDHHPTSLSLQSSGRSFIHSSQALHHATWHIHTVAQSYPTMISVPSLGAVSIGCHSFIMFIPEIPPRKMDSSISSIQARLRFARSCNVRHHKASDSFRVCIALWLDLPRCTIP